MTASTMTFLVPGFLFFFVIQLAGAMEEISISQNSTLKNHTDLEIVAKNDTVRQNSSLDCGVDMMSDSQEAEDYMSTWGTCSFWMEGVLLTSIGIVGLIGNILSIIVLSKPDMYNSFNNLLIALSTLDSIFIILAIIDYAIFRAFRWSAPIAQTLFQYTFPFVIYPLNNISFCASIFTTVAMAYERHTAVCKPIHYRNVTAKYSVKRRTACYVIPVLLIAIILNVPKWMETKYKWTPVESNSTNLTESEAEIEYKMEFEISELRDNPNYIHYYVNWTRLLTTGLIPMVMLIYFNFGIFRGIQMTHERTKKQNKGRASEMNLAAILMCIVFLFFVCHFPRILLNVHEVFMVWDMLACGDAFTPPVWFQCFISFNHLLLIINASCNFLIYVSVGDKFKTTIENFCQSSLGCKACWIKRNHSAASPLGNDTEENGKSMPLLQISSKHRNGKNNESIRTQIGNLEHSQVETIVEVNHQKNGQNGQNDQNGQNGHAEAIENDLIQIDPNEIKKKQEDNGSTSTTSN